MNLHGLTVCVNYSDLLSRSVERWVRGLDSLTVVTDEKDAATAELCRRWAVSCVQTDIFYAHGATFNKAAAMEEGRGTMPVGDWHLFFDSDIVPPVDWRQTVERSGLIGGNIYGAWRHQSPDLSEVNRTDLPRIKTDGPCVGYFQMFHDADPLAQEPLPGFTHAGVYDCLFKDRWPVANRIMLPLYLVHLGERDNWWGRGRKAEFEAMQAERKVRGGWEHERVIA